jgi:hypothetical protein
MVRAAVARAGFSADVVPEVRDMVCFHLLMSNAIATPEHIGILIDAFMPGMGAAMEEETRAAGLSLTVSRTTH